MSHDYLHSTWETLRLDRFVQDMFESISSMICREKDGCDS